jgi:hypothetical protein
LDFTFKIFFVIKFRFEVGFMDGYRDWKADHKKPRHDRKTLEFVSQNLFQLLGKPWTTKWSKDLRSDLEELAHLFQNIATYLERHNQRELEHQQCLHPARTVRVLHLAFSCKILKIQLDRQLELTFNILNGKDISNSVISTSLWIIKAPFTWMRHCTRESNGPDHATWSNVIVF